MPHRYTTKHPLDSMHRCLNVDEIVRLIAYELVTSGRKATAVCLACCCKGFEDPVLDVLWATQTKLSPLFDYLSGEVLEEHGYFTVSISTTRIPLFPQRLGLKVLQMLLDGDGTDPSWKVRPKNAKARGLCRSENYVLEGLFHHATKPIQEIHTPKSDDSRFVESRRIVCSVHSIASFP